jgi:ribosomal protein L7/L12
MELFLIPLLILVVVVALGLLLLKTAKRRSAPTDDGGETGRQRARTAAPATSKEHSEVASSRLNQQQHTAVYSAIARGDALRAIKDYRAATGAGLREAAAAVANMSAHPQPYTPPSVPKPQDGPDTAQPDSVGPAERSTASEPVSTPEQLAAPESSTTADASAARASVTPATGYRYRAIVSKGDEIREIASTRLNDEVFARIRARALDGDKEAAVQLLMEHSDASQQEASGFVELIHDEPPAGAPEGP